MYKNKKVAALILNYNDSKRALSLSKNIKKLPFIDCVLVVDNCSTDNSFDYLIKNSDSFIKVVKSSRNGGYAFGNNYGMNVLKNKGYDLVFICNTDVFFSEKFVESCIKAIVSGYSMVSGIMVMPSGKRSTYLDYHINSFKEDFLECFYLGRKVLRLKRRNDTILPQDNIVDVEMLPGSLMCVNLRDFFECGGFDENTFLYGEERILGRRFKEKNLKIGLISTTEYIHQHSTSISQKYNVVNQMKMLYQSRYYYHVSYNHINFLKKLIYKIACFISITEFSLRKNLIMIQEK